MVTVLAGLELTGPETGGFLLFIILYYAVIFLAAVAATWLAVEAVLSVGFTVAKKTRPRYVLDPRIVWGIIAVIVVLIALRFGQLNLQNNDGLSYNRKAALAYAEQYKDAVVLSHAENTVVEFPQRPPGIGLKYANKAYVDQAVITQVGAKYFTPEAGTCDYYKMISNIEYTYQKIQTCQRIGVVNGISLYSSGTGDFFGKYQNIALKIYEPSRSVDGVKALASGLYITDNKALQDVIRGPNFNTNYVPWINEWYKGAKKL